MTTKASEAFLGKVGKQDMQHLWVLVCWVSWKVGNPNRSSWETGRRQPPLTRCPAMLDGYRMAERSRKVVCVEFYNFTYDSQMSSHSEPIENLSLYIDPLIIIEKHWVKISLYWATFSVGFYSIFLRAHKTTIHTEKQIHHCLKYPSLKASQSKCDRR